MTTVAGIRSTTECKLAEGSMLCSRMRSSHVVGLVAPVVSMLTSGKAGTIDAELNSGIVTCIRAASATVRSAAPAICE